MCATSTEKTTHWKTGDPTSGRNIPHSYIGTLSVLSLNLSVHLM